MKKATLLTFLSFCLLSLTSSAQITKGSVLLGGGISGGKTKKGDVMLDYSKTSTVVISPTVGIAVKDNTVVGLRLAYSHFKEEQPVASVPYIQVQNGWSTGVFYRRYMPLGKKFYLFGEGAVYYGHNSLENTYTNVNSKSKQTNNTIGINFYPGIAYAVNRKIHLEVGLNNLFDFSYSKGKSETGLPSTPMTVKNSGFNVSTNVSTSTPLSVGFRIVLGK